MFQPRNYTVTLDGKAIFNGTDYSSVKFTAKTEIGEVSGQCEAHVTLVESKTNLPMEFALIPKSAVASCKVGATSDGRSTRFIRTEECDKHLYKDLAPLIGPVVPVENLRRCTLDLSQSRIFDGLFTTARRF
jgi:hypothetical protein